MRGPIAHNFDGRRQSLKRHSLNVASRMGREPCLPGPLAEAIGAVHDVGKALPFNQERLLRGGKMRPHARVSAALMRKDSGDPGLRVMENLLSQIPASHHTGLNRDFDLSEGGWLSLLSETMPEIEEEYERTGPYMPAWLRKAMSAYRRKGLPMLAGVEAHFREIGERFGESPEDARLIEGRHMGRWAASMETALIAADHGDTAEFAGQEASPPGAGAEELAARAAAFARGLLSSPKSGEGINRLRCEILRKVLSKAWRTDKLLSLSSPTGSGKTAAALCFAGLTAPARGCGRIIYIGPFTNLVSQTAAAARKVFGEENVLELHSSFETGAYYRDLDGEGKKRVLEAQDRLSGTWESPVVVTTAFQFFTALNSFRPSLVRRLDKARRSVIIVDEAHLLPERYIRQILEDLRAITDENIFDCTVLFTSATPLPFSEIAPGLEPLELLEDAGEYYEAFAHTEIRDMGEASLPDLAEAGSGHRSGVYLFNTKPHARRMFGELSKIHPEGTVFLLSHDLTRIDLQKSLDAIRERLDEGLECHVACTPIIEAGCDLSFEVGFREMSGVPHILQTAGRVNRNGEMESASCFVFSLEVRL